MIPFHEGEIYVQQKLGETDTASQNGAGITDQIPRGALGFLKQQNMVTVASHDSNGAVWVSALIGKPGFVQAPSTRQIEINLQELLFNPADPLWNNMESSDELGFLALELATRRRLKVNGTAHRTADHLILQVQQAFALCPKYIQRRSLSSFPASRVVPESNIQRGQSLDAAGIGLIANVDTLFVGSRHPDSASSDSAHRGGHKGFVQVIDEQTLRLPDYPGNSMFNTLGNLHLNPKSGLLMFDFEGRRTLQLTGYATIRWDLTGPSDATGGTGRMWDFSIDRWIRTELPAGLDWAFLDESPFLPITILASSRP